MLCLRTLFHTLEAPRMLRLLRPSTCGHGVHARARALGCATPRLSNSSGCLMGSSMTCARSSSSHLREALQAEPGRAHAPQAGEQRAVPAALQPLAGGCSSGRCKREQRAVRPCLQPLLAGECASVLCERKRNHCAGRRARGGAGRASLISLICWSRPPIMS